jgi:saccharopine dehydrogenase (NAD+, L-lysine-forming)
MKKWAKMLVSLIGLRTDSGEVRLKILVIGGGAAGQVICTHLSKAHDLDVLKIADLDLKKVKAYAAWLNNEKVSVEKLNAGNEDAVARRAHGMDLVVNALEPIYNLKVLRAALRAGANYQDLAFGPPYETLDKELKMDPKWKKAGLTALTGTGNTPGITNILASLAADELDAVEGVKIVVFSKMDSTELISTWSPATMIEDMMLGPTIYENGQFKTVPPFTGEEVYKFPEPVGPQTVSYHAHEEPHTLPRYIGKGISYVGFKYGVNRLMKDLLGIGLLSKKPVRVNGVKVAPVNVVVSCYPKPLGMEELRAKIVAGIVKGSIGCNVIEVWGKKLGKDIHETYHVQWPDLKEIHRIMPHATHTSYMAGTGAAILTEPLARGQIETKGVFAPEGNGNSVARNEFSIGC